MVIRKLLLHLITILILLTIISSDESSSSSTTTIDDSSSATTSSSNGNSNNQEVESPMAHLELILTMLGFQELAVAVPSLSDSAYYTWNGPSTVFAPTDDSIRSCIGSGSVSSSCSVPQILREHIVPGIFSYDYLRNLAFGTKLETMSSGRCITVTSNNNNHDSSSSSNNDTSTIVYIGGVEITHPDFFNNGLVVVHRLEGFISPLSPFSCNIWMNSLSFPPTQSDNNNNPTTTISSSSQSSNNPHNTSPALMRLMLKDAMLRLHNNGFSVLSNALKSKYPEIVNLQNMTVFALDDAFIFSGGHAYLSNFRFYIVPNKMMLSSDLMRLPTGTTLPTLDPHRSLRVTTAGNGGVGQIMSINKASIQIFDVVTNLKIAVHSVSVPFTNSSDLDNAFFFITSVIIMLISLTIGPIVEYFRGVAQEIPQENVEGGEADQGNALQNVDVEGESGDESIEEPDDEE